MKHFTAILLLTLLCSCSVQTDEPTLPDVSVRAEQQNLDFFGRYITEDHKDLIEIFPNHCFYYQTDCNNQKRINDFNTWEIGRWSLDEVLWLDYEDGRIATAEVFADSIVYRHEEITRLFLPSSKINISVTIDPNFNHKEDE